MIIKFCSCGRPIATQDINEGLGCCRHCQKRKGLKVKSLFKVVPPKPNPAQNLWAKSQEVAK